jgi:hypothetical protein
MFGEQDSTNLACTVEYVKKVAKVADKCLTSGAGSDIVGAMQGRQNIAIMAMCTGTGTATSVRHSGESAA